MQNTCEQVLSDLQVTLRKEQLQQLRVPLSNMHLEKYPLMKNMASPKGKKGSFSNLLSNPHHS